MTEQWQQVGNAAELFQRHIVPHITSIWARDLIERAELQRGERVIDVACGTGVVTRLAAKCVGGARVVGLDLNREMLRVAQSEADVPGAPIEWCEGSALALPFEAGDFDVVLCQLGLQFFPDKAVAMREMARVLVHGGKVALSVFSAIEQTPVAQALVTSLDRHLGAGASSIKRAEHAFSNSKLLARLARDAGFTDVIVKQVRQTIRFTSTRDYVRIQLTATPQAQLLAAQAPDEREATIEAIATDLAGALGSRAASELFESSRVFRRID